MTPARIILNHIEEISAAYKLLKPYVNGDEYFAYQQGLMRAVELLQDQREKDRQEGMEV